MIVKLPHEILLLSQKITEAVLRQKNPSEILNLSSQLYNQIVDFIGQYYFDLKEMPKKTFAINPVQLSSYFDFDTDITTIGLPSYLNPRYAAIKLIADTVHEGSHCCQKEFDTKRTPTVSGYTEALCCSLANKRVCLKTSDGILSTPIKTYIDQPNTLLHNLMYYAQPCETQANAISSTIIQSLQQEHIINNLELRNLQFIKENSAPLILLAKQPPDQHNIISEMAKIQLNLHHNQNFAIQQLFLDSYKDFFMGLLPENEKELFKNYQIASQYVQEKEYDVLKDVVSSLGPIDGTKNAQKFQNAFEESLLHDIVLSTDANLKYMQLTIAGHQYQAPVKDINEFLFVIGEKRFIDISHHGPEKSENYAVEEIEKV